MGSQQSTKKCNFEDIQSSCIQQKQGILINTLPTHEQDCLIENTLPIHQEEKYMNTLMKENIHIPIFIYGKHSNDDSVYKKCEQLLSLGFMNVYVYVGGLFEWLCLQDIYGFENFPTTKKELDILRFRPCSIHSSSINAMLTYT